MINKKLRKAISVLLILALLPIGSATAARHSFNDVLDDAWYSEAVQFVYENNIMGGVGNNQFNPQGNLTRSAVAALLFRVHNGRTASTQDDRNNNFNDVGNTWYAPYITWAFNNNIVFGTSPTAFNPHGNITRQEFATMMYRYAMNMTDLHDEGAASAQWLQFADRGQIATWAYSALRWMNFHGIVTGSTATAINPTGTATRAEAAVMMMRFVRENERLSADFVLTISVEETSLPQSEPFIVNVELRNNSGEDHEIVHSGFGLFQSIIPGRDGWHPFGDPAVDPPAPISRFFEANSVIRQTLHVGSSLEPGTHELQISAAFRLLDIGQEIGIRSDIVTLAVTRGVFELTISAEETTLPQGEPFLVNVELKNNSGESHEIHYSILFWPHIPGWSPIDFLGRRTSPSGTERHRNTRLFEIDGVIRNLVVSYERVPDGMGHHLVFSQDETEPWIIDTARLEPGTHELQFSAGFTLVDNETGRWQRMIVLSNPITLTVQ